MPKLRAVQRRGDHSEWHCVADHDRCYQNCAGQVAYTTQWLANCA